MSVFYQFFFCLPCHLPFSENFILSYHVCQTIFPGFYTTFYLHLVYLLIIYCLLNFLLRGMFFYLHLFIACFIVSQVAKYIVWCFCLQYSCSCCSARSFHCPWQQMISTCHYPTKIFQLHVCFGKCPRKPIFLRCFFPVQRLTLLWRRPFEG